MQGSDLDPTDARRTADLLWALSLPSLVAPVFPPAGAARRPTAPIPDRSQSRATSVPVITAPDHWMPDRFFHQLAVAATAATSGGSTGRAPLPIVGSRRHGLIYEDMLAWAIGAAREIDLLARDITVTREGRTLGQADLLLRWEGTVYHLEVAIKFYLRRSAPGDLAGYIGTDLRDRMDRKLAHLLFHQRHILDGVAGRHALERRGVTPPARRCVSLRGCIFEPLDPENTGASGFPRYWWAPERLWRRVAGESEYRWRRVDRKLWFSPITDPETGWAPALDLVALMTDGRASVAVAGARPGEPEITRGIVVRNVF